MEVEIHLQKCCKVKLSCEWKATSRLFRRTYCT